MPLRGFRPAVSRAATFALLACGSCASATTTSPTARSSGDVEAKLAAVALVHGGAGPWAVAGFRMGEFALRELGLSRGSFDLEVIHYTPHQVQYSCVADGEAASTGASLGKLNLTLADAAPAETHTVFKRRSSGQSVDLRFTAAFAARYLDVPRDRLAEAGREVMGLRDTDIFEVVRSTRP
ncbi:MAG TPA: formylmethanofuran dehydrogenase subunit E family protein [Polyangiaceae bacterium]|nr:formylmethanofuran dehydrogenase subunit E family protein [Polyangiaceae bacterium]